MNFSKKTVIALISKELKDYYRNPIVLIILFLPILFTIFYSNTFSNYILKINICINSDIIFSGLFLPQYLITEEKENYTLDALILFSVNSIEFLIGKLLPCIFFSLFANLLSLFILKLNAISFIQIAFLIFISLLGLILIGALIGFICKNQPEAMICSIITIAVLYVIPIIGNINAITSKISLFLGISNMDLLIKNILKGKTMFYSLQSLFIMLIWVIIPICIYIYMYKHKDLS